MIQKRSIPDTTILYHKATRNDEYRAKKFFRNFILPMQITRFDIETEFDIWTKIRKSTGTSNDIEIAKIEQTWWQIISIFNFLKLIVSNKQYPISIENDIRAKMKLYWINHEYTIQNYLYQRYYCYTQKWFLGTSIISKYTSQNCR